jgi:uncharacterized membrane protein
MDMAKAALTMVAFLAVFAVLVLVGGSIGPQRQVQAARATGKPIVARGQVIEPIAAERRETGN